MATEHHPVTLRVMRLRKPSFGGVNGMVPNTITTFPGDCCSGSQGVQMLSESAQEGLGMSSLLALPAAFGDIHLGELFKCYITVFNHTSDEVTNVSIQSEISFLTQHVSILDNSKDPIPVLTNSRSEFIGTYRVTQACIHILSCVCTYKTPYGTERSFKKFFKFQVTDPFSILTKVIPITNGYWISATITNVSTKHLILDGVEFKAPEIFSCEKLGTEDFIPSSGLPTGTMLAPTDTISFLFGLKFIDLQNPNVDIDNMGRFLFEWLGPFGERGIRETPELTNTVPYKRSVSLLVENMPKSVTANVPFTLNFQVINRAGHSITPTITVSQKDPSIDISVVGVACKNLPEVPGKSSVPVSFQFLALKPGVHKLTGISIFDKFTKNNYNFVNVIELFVERENLPSDKSATSS